MAAGRLVTSTQRSGMAQLERSLSTGLPAVPKTMPWRQLAVPSGSRLTSAGLSG